MVLGRGTLVPWALVNTKMAEKWLKNGCSSPSKYCRIGVDPSPNFTHEVDRKTHLTCIKKGQPKHGTTSHLSCCSVGSDSFCDRSRCLVPVKWSLKNTGKICAVIYISYSNISRMAPNPQTWLVFCGLLESTGSLGHMEHPMLDMFHATRKFCYSTVGHQFVLCYSVSRIHHRLVLGVDFGYVLQTGYGGDQLHTSHSNSPSMFVWRMPKLRLQSQYKRTCKKFQSLTVPASDFSRPPGPPSRLFDW